MEKVANDVDNGGLLDYVSGWYLKAAEYITGTKATVAFVSTNSITQGEQVGTLWNHLFRRFGIKIHFGYRTFKWKSESRGEAHVHVVIIGFGSSDREGKKIYETHEDGHLSVANATNISPYLVQGMDKAIENASNQISGMLKMESGNQPIDSGNLLFTPEEKEEFLRKEPHSREYFKIWLGGEEFLNGIERYVLDLRQCPAEKIKKMPSVLERLRAIQIFRSQSKRAATRKLAQTPTQYQVNFFCEGSYLALPEVSSERREYMPIAYLGPAVVCGNKLRLVPNATRFQFGVLTSKMHMDWMRAVTGRLKSDYQYSVKLVYNNFPWLNPSEKQKQHIAELAEKVLEARAVHQPPKGRSTLADLYDPLTMPADLHKAHQKLDAAVDTAYRKEPFNSARERVEFLFRLHSEINEPMNALAAQKPKRKAKAKK
jgi:hypothetical protein